MEGGGRVKAMEVKDIQNAKLRTTMSDGSEWDVPVGVIMKSRANYYMDLDGITFEEAWADTAESFASNPFEIIDWAQGNMDWDDVVGQAEQVIPPDDVDYDDGWINGAKSIITPREARS